MGMLVQVVVVDKPVHAALALLAPVLVAQQILVGDDVRPVVAAGVVHAQQHLAAARDGSERLQGLRRHRRDAKHHHAARQAGDMRLRRLRRLQVLHKALVHGGAAGLHSGGAHIVQQRAP